MKSMATLTAAALVVAFGTGLAPYAMNEAHAGPVDLSTWVEESYPSVLGFPPGSWVLAPDNLSVTQQNNGQPTFFVSDFNAIGTTVEGTIEVLTTGDDDFVGFALGILPGDSTNLAADYLLIDWKQGDQWYDFQTPSCTPGSVAWRGLAVSRVTGIPTADEFWGHLDFGPPTCSPLGDGLAELQRGLTRGSTGWADNTPYTFRFEFTATSLKVFVDGTKEIDIGGEFFDGRLAFYNFSQNLVRYSGFEVTPLVADINIKPDSDPNSINLCSNGSTPVTIWGSENLDVATIDMDQLTFASASVKTVGKSNRSLCSIADVGAPDDTFFDNLDPTPDGFEDLTCHFITFDLGGLDDSSLTATVGITGCDDGVSCVAGNPGFYEATGEDSVNIVKDDCL